MTSSSLPFFEEKSQNFDALLHKDLTSEQLENFSDCCHALVLQACGKLENFVPRSPCHVHAKVRAKRFIDFGKLAKSVHNTDSFISRLGKDTAMSDHRSER